MLTKAIIVEIIDRYNARVRIPTIHKLVGTTYSTADSELPIATICSVAGVTPSLQVSDVVYVEFEDNLQQQPVILGWLVNNNNNTKSNIQSASLDVQIDCKLPKQTTIGDISEYDINNIKNSKENIQLQIDNIETTIDKQDKVIEYLCRENHWYRLFKSGWLEQGGPGDTSEAIQFMKEFKDTTYSITATPMQAAAVYISEKTTTNFTIKNIDNKLTTTTGVTWYACGYIKQ